MSSKIVTRLHLTLLLLTAILGCGFLYLYLSKAPPRQDKLVADFEAHRAAYERLRDMLQADKQLVRIADWGVETTSSPLPNKPPEGDFPLTRYKEYLGLLREVGGLGASQGPGGGAEILVWASGWAANTRHIYICWTKQKPSPLVSSLDRYYRTTKPREPAYSQIDGNWYLWADW